LHRVGDAGRRLRAEDFDHPDHGTEQAHERADRGDGAKRRQVAIQIVGNGRTGFLDRLLHDFTRGIDVAQAGGQHAAERRMAVKILKQLVVVGTALELANRTLEQTGRDNLAAAKGHQSLDDQRHRNDRRQQQGVDRPAGRFYDLVHVNLSLMKH
jgi:hypothetical protein